jgi:DNA-binding response OmpR family regulator
VSVRARRAPQSMTKLLVIDTDVKLLASYRDLLSPYGFEILTASDNELAIRLVEDNPDIKLVILDVMAPPEMGSRQWLQWFRSRRAETSPIIITAYEIAEVEASDLQPAATLQKPFHVADLLDLVGLFCGLGTPAGFRTT